MMRFVFSFLFICVGLMACFAAEAANNTPSRPNLLVIFTDDQVFNAIGYDNDQVKTPNLDKLAAMGMIFDRAFVATPICAASRASMMTGLYPQQHGVIALGQRAFQRYRTGGEQAHATLGQRLQDAGYTTAFYGKSHLGDPKRYGFEHGAEIGGHDDVKTFAAAEAFVKSRASDSQPFLLWVAPRQPHVPLYPEQKWLDWYDVDALSLPDNFREAPLKKSVNNQGRPGQDYYRDSNYRKNHEKLSAGPPRDAQTMRRFIQAYYAVVSRLDHQVGSLVEQLEAKGLRENTVIVFLSDNGYHLGSHGLGNKITMHEESVRVPMFITGPGVAGGERTQALVSSLDVFPTLLALAGVDDPEQGVMGESLLGVLGDPAARVREVVFAECVGVGGKPGEGHRMARNDRWKYVLSGTDEAYLFDLENDPHELQNVIDDPAHAETAQQLRAALKGWMQAIGDRDVR